MPPKPRVISKIDQDLEDYLANLAQNAKVEQYNMNTAKMREVEWKRNLFPNVLLTAEQLLAQQQSIITAPTQPIVDDQDVLNNTDYDVEKVTTLQNFVKFGLSPQQADDLLKSIEHRGGDEFRSNGIYRLNGLWAGLKLELSKNFKDGATIPLVSSYIVDEFLAKKHPSTKPTRTEMLFEALDEPLDENVEENLQAHVAKKRAERAFQSIRQAAADHKEEKLEARREDARERGDKQAKKSRFIQGLKSAAEEKKQQMAAEEEEALAKMRETYEARKEPTVSSKKESRKQRAALTQLLQTHATAHQMLSGVDKQRDANAIVRKYIDDNKDILMTRSNSLQFLTKTNKRKQMKYGSIKDVHKHLQLAIDAVTQKDMSRDLNPEFDDAVGKGLAKSKVRLDVNALRRGVLSVRYNSSRLYKISPMNVSEVVRDIISEMHEGKAIDPRLVNRLSAEEQRHIELFAHSMPGIAAKYKIGNKASKDLFERYQILCGEINAGNNNPKLKRELRQVIAQLVDIGRIPHKKGLLVLAAQLGI